MHEDAFLCPGKVQPGICMNRRGGRGEALLETIHEDRGDMKQYVIDQLRGSDYERIRGFLEGHSESTAMEGLYWVEVPEELYAGVQKEHGSCRPFYFAVNLSREQVDFELLVRSRQVLRCSCIAYATPAQREFIIGFADGMVRSLELKI